MIDFGVGEGVEILETINVKYPEDRRHELNKEQFNFSNKKARATYSEPKLVGRRSKGSVSGTGKKVD